MKRNKAEALVILFHLTPYSYRLDEFSFYPIKLYIKFYQLCRPLVGTNHRQLPQRKKPYISRFVHFIKNVCGRKVLEKFFFPFNIFSQFYINPLASFSLLENCVSWQPLRNDKNKTSEFMQKL